MIFQAKEVRTSTLRLSQMNTFPRTEPLPGLLCQAARRLLGLSQEDVSKGAKVAKKTLNDLENSKRETVPAIVLKVREHLEKLGARFVKGQGRFGVIVGQPLQETKTRS